MNISNQTKKFYDYLSMSGDIESFYSCLHEIVSDDFEFSDFSITEFKNDVSIVHHTQTAPQKMLEESFDPDDYNFIGMHIVKHPWQPIYLSEAQSAIKGRTVAEEMFSGFIDAYKVIQDYGFSDFYNIPAVGHNENTLLLSLAHHDMDIAKFKDKILKQQYKLYELITAIKNSIPSIKSATGLTQREIEVIDAVAKTDGTFAVAARKLSVEESTVKFHISLAKKKLGITKTHFLIAQAFKEKLIR